MTLRSLFFSLGVGLALAACGRVVPLAGLPCPCDTDSVCCDNVCVPGASCGGTRVFGSDGATGSDPDSGSQNGIADDSGTGGTICNALNACCPKLPASDQAPCIAEAAAGNEANCDATLSSAGTMCDPGQPDGGGSDDTDAGDPKPEGGPAENAYCYYAGDAGGYDCAYESSIGVSFFGCGCGGTQGNAANAARTELSCMSGGGEVVGVCPTAGLVGCCSTSTGSLSEDPVTAIACSYGVDMSYELNCVANGGTWSTTPPH